MRIQGPSAETSGSSWRAASRNAGGGGWRGGERRLRGTLLPVRGSSAQDLLQLTATQSFERPRVAQATIATQEPRGLCPWRCLERCQDLFESGQYAVIAKLPRGIQKAAGGLERQQLAGPTPLVDGLL